MKAPTLSTYDRFPYSNNAFRNTHPARLRAAGVLLGLESPPIRDCRVLELGCGSGGNLAPMAYAHPNASFVGIDLSQRQIADAQTFARDVGLANIDFRHMSILNLTADFGQFDYIICHGVFSWVPREVQDKILDICRDNLSPAGIAFISFNAYPGSYARRAAREMMLYHTAQIADESDKVQAAKQMLQALAELSPTMKEQWQLVQHKEDTYVLHEYLESTNEPLYLHQFMDRATGRGLQYLADALVNSSASEESAFTLARYSGTEPFSTLARYSGRGQGEGLSDDIVRREQYLDFIRNQSFRRTLLCHASAKLDRPTAASRIPSLRIASPLHAEVASESPLTPCLRASVPSCLPVGNLLDRTPMQFTHPANGFVQSDVPLVKAALWHLQSLFPQSIEFHLLCQRAQASAKVSDADMPLQRQQLTEELLADWQADLIELRADPDPFTTTIPHKPQVSAIARRQAQSGEIVTTLRHDMLTLDADYRALIQWIDGTRTEEMLLKKLAEEGFAPAPTLRPVLEQLAHQALLVADSV